MAAALLLAFVTLVPTAMAAPAPRREPALVKGAIHASSVALDGAGCSGVIAENRQIVLTARHCVKTYGRKVAVRFASGRRQAGWVVGVDDAADQAMVFLPEPAPFPALALARRAQIPGTVLYFEGHPDRPRFQKARLERIGPCPSLPKLSNALHTTISGVPGDSGAPLLNLAGRVVGLVHGGARCQIATPAATLLALIDRVLERRAPAPAVVRVLRLGPRDAEPFHACRERVGREAEAACRAIERRLAVEAVADQRLLDALQDPVERNLAVERQLQASTPARQRKR
jgi:S1-C subfamily serine protease